MLRPGRGDADGLRRPAGRAAGGPWLRRGSARGRARRAGGGRPGAGRLGPAAPRGRGGDRRPRVGHPLPGRADRRDLGGRRQRRARLLAAPGGDGARLRRPSARRPRPVPAHRRPRLPGFRGDRGAVRRRPLEGPHPAARAQPLPAGRRAGGRAQPSGAAAGGRRRFRGGRGRRRAAGRRPRGRAPRDRPAGSGRGDRRGGPPRRGRRARGAGLRGGAGGGRRRAAHDERQGAAPRLPRPLSPGRARGGRPQRAPGHRGRGAGAGGRRRARGARRDTGRRARGVR